MRKLKNLLLAATAISGIAVAGTPAGAITIVLQPDDSFASAANGAAALYAFEKVANYYNRTLSAASNAQNININISFAALDDGILGSTSSEYKDRRTTEIYQALADNSATALDASAVASLVPLTSKGGIGYRRPPADDGTLGGERLDIDADSVFDNNNTRNNRYIYANTANLKALGFDIGNSFVDAEIEFSSEFAFDFDPTDGIATGTLDFVGVAVHEVGHALGFESGTDWYDYSGGDGPGADDDDTHWDRESALSTLDLFRRSASGGDSGFDPATGERYIQLTPGRDVIFTVDGVNPFGGPSANTFFSTGEYNGDGNQASHWKDDSGYSTAAGCYVGITTPIGIMDPTFGDCQMGVVTANDLAAFDAIGYNLNFDILRNTGYAFSSADIFRLGESGVPEPTTWAMMILGFGFGFVGGAMRARKTSVRFAG